MTALLLARSFPPMIGGIEKYVSELFRRLPGPVVAVAPGGAGDETYDREYPHRVVRYWYPWSANSGKLPLLPLAAATLRPALAARPSIVISEQVQTAAVGVPLAAALRVPHVVICHGMELSPLRLRGLKQWALRSSARIITNSRFTRDHVKAIYGIDHERIVIVPPGIDPLFFATAATAPRWPARPQGPTLLTLGRLDPSQRYKGYDRVIRLTAQLKPEFPDIRCLIAGDGPDRAWLQAIANSLGVRAHVEFRGFVPDKDIPGLFAEADLFVLASGTRDDAQMRVEGYGIVLAEAAASGVPSIAYRAGGVSDVVVDGTTGVLTDVSEEALLVATRDLLRSHDRRRSMSAAAIAHARTQLGWNRSVTALSSTIAELTHSISFSQAS